MNLINLNTMSKTKFELHDEKNNGHNSKISRIYIELHNFNFMHGTFHNKSRHFIGRNEIRARLRSVLTHSDSNSGTYLITGQRGVGKTSLVNKVLEELASKSSIGLGFKRYVYLFIALYVLMIFKMYISTEYLSNSVVLERWHTLVNCSAFIIFILASFYICIHSMHLKQGSYVSRNIWVHFLSCVMREYFVLGRERTWESRLARIIKYIGILSGIHLVGTSFLFWFDVKLSHFQIFIAYGALLLFFWGVRSLNKVFINEDFNNIVGRDYRESVKNRKLSPYYYSLLISFFYTCCFLYLPTLLVYTIIEYSMGMSGIIYSVCYIWGIYFLFLLCMFLFIRTTAHTTEKCTDILVVSWKTIMLIIKQHFFFRHLFNTSKQLFIKINLGYDELKSVDVLRLVAHHITLEYRKYIFSFSFFWSKTSLIFISCALITLLASKFVKFDSYTLYKMGDINLFKWIDTLYNQFMIAINLLCYILVQSFKENNFDYREWYVNNQYFNIPISNILFFLLLLGVYKIISYIPWLKFLRAPFHILSELENLQDSIAASIRKEKGISVGVSTSENSILDKFKFHSKTEKNYPMSDVHDIEKKLIDILANIAQKSGFFSKPQFIIIFDELDKIDAAQQENVKSQSKTDSFSPETIRNRQDAIFKLLSGLKYFLTTAQAKFIFVAGREIYEASLADMVDRSHYLSSIFNDVINIPSFMSDFSDGRENNIFSTTEQFVCRYLFPRGYITSDYTLASYNQYMIEMDENLLKKNKNDNKDEFSKELKLEREKIIVLLNSFIIYLTHIGKGAPKKIIDSFEKYVDRVPPYKMDVFLEKNHPMQWIVRKRQKNSIYFLKFDFLDQYTISLVSYLVNPVILRFNSSKIHQHGDKLLISSLFFLDHLYKFHRNAFSWRALESSPELIDVNKTPELRDHITDLLHFLSQNHLKSVNNGLYNFCFYKKVSHEINFLTSVSEQASAIFNFTLDESYSVKQYYRSQLEYIRKQYEADNVKRKQTVDELATLHFTLGELHLYDEEIEDAIIEFDNSYSILSTLEPKEMTSEQIIVLIKTMLSLGIAYERKKLNDQAFLIYSEAVRLIIASRNIELKGLGLYSEEDKNRMIVKPLKKYGILDEPEIYFRDQCEGKSFITALDDLRHLHPDIHSIISKFTAYEGIRLLYLPLLAKFQMLEKSQLGGIQKRDIKRLLKEFSFLTNMLNKENKHFIKSDFYAKVADILYYKNSMIITDFENFQLLFPDDLYEDENEKILECKDCSKGKKRIPCDSCFFYRYSLALLLKLKCSLCENYISQVLKKLKEIKDSNYAEWEDSRFSLLAEILSNLGDIYLSCQKHIKKASLSNDLVTYLNDLIDNQNGVDSFVEKYNKFIKSDEDNNKYVNILTLYLLSALFYKKSTSFNLNSFQYIKILNLLTMFESTKNTEIENIAFRLSKKAIKGICNSFKDLQQIKEEEISKLLQGCEDTERIHPRRLLINNDIFEIVLLFQRIRLKYLVSTITASTLSSTTALFKVPVPTTVMARVSVITSTKISVSIPVSTSDLEIIKDIYSMFSKMSYEIVSSIYNRIYMLEFKSTLNELLLVSLMDKELTDVAQFVTAMEYGKYEKEKKENIAYYVINSICNLQEILKFIQVYGETYLFTNYFIAEVHHKLMLWLMVKDKMKIVDKFLDLLEIPSSEHANAIRAYYKAEELHKEGRTYKNMIERSCYLSDEYNDQRFHFLIAQERYYINVDDYRDLKKMNKILPSDIDVYDVRRFIKLL